MSRAPFIRTALLALIGLLAVAFAAIGGGHASPRVSDPAYEAYLLSGGSAGDLCPADLYGTASHDCPVCTLTGKAVLPTVPLVVIRQAHALDLPALRPASVPRAGDAPRPYAARGPPVPI